MNSVASSGADRFMLVSLEGHCRPEGATRLAAGGSNRPPSFLWIGEETAYS